MSNDQIPTAFWLRVEKSDDGCWYWTGSIDDSGYAVWTVKGHRLSYELAKGPVDHDQVVHHVCHNRNCVNPKHLEAISPKENLKRRKDRANERHCKHGTSWSESYCSQCWDDLAKSHQP